ncbi:polymorphic toxin-type HINT domain-containing protein [Butyrivibrio sp. MC2013]|uniref:polymorphic toxin-type HINT domain-containing protein n=1 Tax=Butyrivibrio sp. MC2013 TaxID=1280686 RepID=UPI000400C35B|nr:polymorphic toxin-type HINT domain-containing protein [Butyrivibrio sp. MC2013]
MGKRANRILSMILTLVVLTGAVHTNAYAAGSGGDATASNNEAAAVTNGTAPEDEEENLSVGESEKASIVSEIVEGRDEYIKEYQMSDDSKSIVVYSEPVHYESEDGSFVEIDNSLVETDEGYENADNSYHVTFTDNEESQGKVHFEEDEYEIGWEYLERGLITRDSDDFDKISEEVKANNDEDRAETDKDDNTIDEKDDVLESDYSELDHKFEADSAVVFQSNDELAFDDPASDDEDGLLEDNDSEDGSSDEDTDSEEESYNDDDDSEYGSSDEDYDPDEDDSEDGSFENDPDDEDHADYDDNDDYDYYYDDDYIPSDLDVSVEDEDYDQEALEEYGHIIKRSTITYDGYENGVKLEYAPTGTGVKENIILDNKESGNSFSFKIALKGLKARLLSSNEVELYDEESGEVVYYFPAPFMTDAKGKESVDVWYSIAEAADVGKYDESDDITGEINGGSRTVSDNSLEDSNEESSSTVSDNKIDDRNSTSSGASIDGVTENADGDYFYLTITADNNWLSAASYPVSIDPIIKRVKNNLAIDSGCINNKGAKNKSLYVGNENGAIYRSFIKFELPDIEKGCVVTDAQLDLSGTGSSSSDKYLAIVRLDEDWIYKDGDNCTINSWDSQPMPLDPDEAKKNLIDYDVPGGYFNITRLARQWYSGKCPNYGIGVMAYDENSNWKSKETVRLSADKGKPYLKISFKNFTGLESYFENHKVAAGTSGIGYINDYSGALTVVNTDVSTNGLRMPFNIQHVYNAGFAPEDAWHLSYDERIEIPTGLVDVNTYPYLYTDEDGTKHYFKAKSVTYIENGEKTTASKTPKDSVLYPAAADEDGLKLYIVPVTDKKLKSKYPLKLIDKSASKVKYFDKAGRLARISDSNHFENGKNAKDKNDKTIVTVANNLTIGHENTGDKYPIDKYNEAVSCLQAIYDYTKIKSTNEQIETKKTENVNRIQELMNELLSDPYARSDYRVGQKVYQVREKLNKLFSNSYDMDTLTKTTSSELKVLKSARSTASGIDLHDERIVSVMDAVGLKSVVSYDAEGRVSTISDPTRDDAVNTYSYDDKGRLTSIVFANGKSALYTYDEDDNLTAMQDDSGYKLSFDYADDRVSKVSEWSGDNKGQTYTIEYGDNDCNVFRFSGQDDIFGNSDDILNTYVFDEKGRLITKYSKRADSVEVLGAQSQTYADNGVVNTARTDYDDQATAKYENLIKNPDFESDMDSWEIITEDKSRAEITGQDKYLYSKSLKLSAPEDDFVLVRQKLKLDAGTYAVSFRIKVVSDEKNAKFTAFAYDNDYDTKKIEYKSSADDGKWVRVYGSFELKTQQEISLGLYAENGTKCYFDTIHLEKGTVAHDHSTTVASSAPAADSTSEEDNGLRYKIKDYAVTGRQTFNLLQNHSFENDDKSWEAYITDGSSTANAVSKYGKTTPYIGARSAVFALKNLKNKTGGVRQLKKDLEAGTYTLSAYVYNPKATGTKAYIKVTDAAGNEYKSEEITDKTLSQFNDGWDRIKLTFDNPLKQDVTVALEVFSDGTDVSHNIVYDCVQLEKGDVANDYNILEDGDFELASEGLPYSWKRTGDQALPDGIVGEGIDGGRSYHINGIPGKDKTLTTTLQLGDATSSYVLSGWIRTTSTPVRKGRELSVSAVHDTLSSKLKINEYSSGWKYFSMIMPAHQWKDTKLTISFNKNAGDLYIDGLQLSRVNVGTKKYDKEGHAISKASIENSTSTTYDSYNRVKTVTSPGGVTETYSYNKAGKNSKVAKNYGPNTHLTYDKYGNVVAQRINKEITKDENGNAKDTPLQLYTRNTYTDNGNYLKSTIDTAGSVTSYSYDEKSGLMLESKEPVYNAGHIIFVRESKNRYEFLGSEKTYPIANDVIKYIITNPEAPLQTSNELVYEYDESDNISGVTRKSNEESRSVSYEYGALEDLKSINHNGFEYSYTYDDFGNIITKSVAGTVVEKSDYNPNNGSLKSTSYADGTRSYMDYDEYGNITDQIIETADGEKFTDSYKYYNDGRVASFTDGLCGIDTEYDYNLAGKISRTRVEGNTYGFDYSSRMQYTYNTMGLAQQIALEYKEGDADKLAKYNYSYAKDGNITKAQLPAGSFKDYKYDDLRRNTKTIYAPTSSAKDDAKLLNIIAYTGGKASSKSYKGTQTKVRSYVNKLGTGTSGNYNTESTFVYDYDDRGNICVIDQSAKKPKANPREDGYFLYPEIGRVYEYNAFGEVWRAREHYADGTRIELSYEYDEGGNILKETKYNIFEGEETTNSYTYDSVWKDQLKSFNGKEITYDVCGNPINYMGKAMSWNAVNDSLTSISDTDKDISYSYYTDGVRLSKEVKDKGAETGKRTVYFYNNGMLIAEETDSDRINFYYDSDGIVTEIGYKTKDANGKYSKENRYFYTRNGQGDIIGIYRCSDSKLVGNYEYDLWGNIVSITPNSKVTDTDNILNRNPLRYRSYYYDSETGFYYLNARYYDPETHRFISADSQIAGVSDDVTGYNLYAYCDNDPVNKIDATGCWPTLTNKQKVAVGLAVIGVAAVLTVATAGATGGLACFAMGALEGSIAGAASGAVSGAAVNAGITFVTSGGDLEKTKQAAVDGACDGFMSGAITGFITGGMTSKHCFVAGTLVATIDGMVPIEDISPGDLVLSEDPKTGDVTYQMVWEIYENDTNDLIHLTISKDSKDGKKAETEEIVTTPAHPFYVKDTGFVTAEKLEVGTTLVDNEGNEIHLQNKRWQHLRDAVPVYNFAVDNYHTYFVGSTNVLVHNFCASEEEFNTWLNKGEANNSVYHGMEGGNATYTGITKQPIQNRLYQHLRSGKPFNELKVRFPKLTRNQARAIEQFFIEMPEGPNLRNIINSISPDNKYYYQAMEWAAKYIAKSK